MTNEMKKIYFKKKNWVSLIYGTYGNIFISIYLYLSI